MSDPTDIPMESNDQVTPVGHLLTNAREQQNLSIDDVCTQLRISPRQVKALENDDFAALPEATITRGFIRNYARLLSMDAEPLLQAYRAAVPAETPRALSLQSENILISSKSSQPWLKYILISLFIALLLGGWQFYMDMPKPVAEQLSTPEQAAEAVTETQGGYPVVTESLPMPVLPSVESAADLGVSDEGTTADPIAEPQAGIAPPSEAASVSAGGVQSEPQVSESDLSEIATLKLSFSGRSWVNVIDKDKKILFDRIMPAGSEEVIEGKPPLSVVIGNAPVSKLIFNGKPVDLAPYTKVDVARVVLE
jgi:cytoskeleton protein RodZ